MSDRESGNVHFVCKEHAPKPDPRWAEKPLDFFLAKFVKKGFSAFRPGTQIPTVEHMWAKVVGVTSDGLLIGELNNDPVNDMELVLGDTVYIDPKDIEAVFGEARETP